MSNARGASILMHDTDLSLPPMQIPRGDAIALLESLVRVDSRNPDLVPGAPGEGEVARSLAATLDAWGFVVELQEAAPGRPNVIARA